MGEDSGNDGITNRTTKEGTQIVQKIDRVSIKKTKKRRRPYESSSLRFFDIYRPYLYLICAISHFWHRGGGVPIALSRISTTQLYHGEAKHCPWRYPFFVPSPIIQEKERERERTEENR